jgi:transposase
MSRKSNSTHPAQKRYPPELRDRAVRMVLELRREDPGDHGVISRVARQLSVGTESLRTWVRQAEVDGGVRPGVSSEDKARIADLERENRELRRANEILKASASFMWTPRLCGLGPVAGAVAAGHGGSGPGRRSA